jgi:hypothetical protein
MAKRRFRIEAGRYGGELAIGEVDKEFVDYFIDKDEEELIAHVTSYEWDGPENTDAPKPKEDFYAWYETDDKEHLNNAYADAGFYVSEVPADGSDDFAYDENEKEIKGYHLYDREAYHDAKLEGATYGNDEERDKDYVPVLAFHSAEKGGFACWFVETDGEDFDEKKFAYSTVATTLAELVEEVWYDKELLESNYDHCDTTGKGYYASVGYMNTKWHDSEPTEETLNEYWEGYDVWREED